jgi:hypothetical protein
MHSLKSKFTEASKKYAGVSFTVHNLNTIRRAERDAAIASHRLEYTRLTAERATQFKALAGEEGTAEERNARVNALPLEKRLAILEMDEKAQHIYERFIVPNAIRHGLIGVEGLELDGTENPTADDILAGAPDDLIEEIYAACVRGSGLTEDEAKN